MAKTISLSRQEETDNEDILTIDAFRACKGCGHYSDEEAIIIIKSLITLASIIVASLRKKSINIDNQHVVHLNPQKQAA